MEGVLKKTGAGVLAAAVVGVLAVVVMMVMLGVAVGGCVQEKGVGVEAVCERDSVGNYVLKWEPVQGVGDREVEVYVSKDPEVFEMGQGASLRVSASGCRARYVTGDNVTRYYFRLLLDKSKGYTVGERRVRMDSVVNLRDMGGYASVEGGKRTRWGLVYRCGDISRLSGQDSLRLCNLGLRTVIDMRSEEEQESVELRMEGVRVVRIPLTVNTLGGVSGRLCGDRMQEGDAVLHMQDMYGRMERENREGFALALREFLLRDNYPILVSCTFGKDACGLLSALLLTALGVPQETILEDYQGGGLTVSHMVRYLDYPSERLTDRAVLAGGVLLSADGVFLDPVYRGIEVEYGGLEGYLGRCMGVSRSDRVHLRNILLK
jgi:protein-tyrosine phosphatase